MSEAIRLQLARALSNANSPLLLRGKQNIVNCRNFFNLVIIDHAVTLL
jgi:hypothetical protein